MKKIGEKEAWAYLGTDENLGTAALSQEREKLRISNLAGIFISERPSEQNPIKNFGEKGAWAYPGTAHCSRIPHPLLSQERVKLRISNFACTFTGSIGTKAH